MHAYKKRTFNQVLIIIILFSFVCTTFMPLVINLFKISWNNIPELLTSTLFKEAILNSINVASTATIFSIIIGFLLSYSIECTNIKYKSIWKVIFTLPMLLPSISHGLGLMNLFGESGFIKGIWNIDIDLYGYKGIVLGLVLYTYPIAMLMFSDTFNFLDRNLYDMCKSLGIPKVRVFMDVTLIAFKKPVIMAFFTIFTMVFTDYGVALAIGGKFNTLAILLYREVIGLLDFSKGGFIALILTIPALIAFIIDLKVREEGGVDTSYKNRSTPKNKRRDVVAYTFCILMGIMIVMPIIASIATFLVEQYPINMTYSPKHIESIEKKMVLRYLSNAIIIALSTALIGTAAAYLVAYITTRIESKWLGKSIHLMALTSLVIPGVVLGLGYIQLYRSTFLYGTTLIIILVNVTHFFSAPYLLAYNALNKLSFEFDQVAKSLAIGKWRLLFDIFVPTTMPTIIEMFSYFFINAMVTISAVSFLANTKNMPIALMITTYENQLMFEYAAIVSTVILVCNIIFKSIVYGLKKYIC